MSHGISVQVFSQASVDSAVQVLQNAVDKAALRRHSDYISRVILLCTPHYAPYIEDIAHACMSKTNCMNVWGGCVSGLLGNGQVHSDKPTVLIAVFDHAFEPPANPTTSVDVLKLCMVEHEQVLSDSWTLAKHEPDNIHVQADTLGLLSYGANYAKMPRIEHSRPCGDPVSFTDLKVEHPMVFNSEGLTFLTEPQEVSESNGLFLIRVGETKAAQALACPDQQTRPVGLRLQVLHEEGEIWIPVMDIHADGTLGLAAPVMKGQKVRLATRAQGALVREIEEWKPLIKKNFNEESPQLGILFSGFERSQMCHEDETDIVNVLNAFPDVEWIGTFGQAAWLNQAETVVTPARNNRLIVCLFDTPKFN